MRSTPEERAALKKAQIARLALKGTPQYSKAYAAQPEQIRLRAKQDAERAAQRAAKREAAMQAALESQQAAKVFEDAAVSADLTGDSE